MPLPTLEKTLGEDFLTPKEAGALLGVTSVRARQLADSGKLEGLVTPLGRLISRDSVLRRRAMPIKPFGGRLPAAEATDGAA